MEKIFLYLLHALLAYLLSSIPFAILIAKAKGIDILKTGTKNPGAANVARNIGKFYGFLVGFLDILKSYIPTFFAKDYPLLPLIAIAALAIIGHNYSVFLKFKGGRGISTSMGVSLALYPLPFLFTFPVLLILSFAKQVALGMLLLFGITPLVILIFEKSKTHFYISIMVFILLILRRLTISKPKNIKVLLHRLLWDRD